MRPIYDALRDKNFTSQIQFHMPGHLRGRGFTDFEISPSFDVTELFETDDLHNPTGVIKTSEEYAAGVLGAKRAYYMVNGSTGGVLAMTLGFLGAGDKVIADRACHKSFVSALTLSGASPVWVYPRENADRTMWGAVTKGDVLCAIEENPDAKAVYMTAPNYFGMMGDVSAIAETAHMHGMALLVDGAHGAHYGMNRHLPPSLISLGADAVCLSLHKTLPALTQSAILLTNRRCERVEAALKTVQSSSPNYLLMSSCENAVRFYEHGNEHGWEELYEIATRLFPEEELPEGTKYKDFSRVNLKLGGSPFDAVRRLREEFNIAVECAYGGGVVAILNSLHKREETEALFKAAKSFEGLPYEPIGFTPVKTSAEATPREAFFAPWREVPIGDAAGKISKDGIMVYPPGVYIVLPGEIITKEATECVLRITAAGGEAVGVKKSYCLIFDE